MLVQSVVACLQPEDDYLLPSGQQMVVLCLLWSSVASLDECLHLLKRDSVVLLISSSTLFCKSDCSFIARNATMRWNPLLQSASVSADLVEGVLKAIKLSCISFFLLCQLLDEDACSSGESCCTP